MPLQIVSGPSAEPVSLAQVKLRLRLTSTNDDALITSQITPAREFAEKITSKSLASKTYKYFSDRFPWSGNAIELPVPPLTGVTAIKYLDENSAPQTWASDLYNVYNLGMMRVHGIIRPVPGGAYPVTLVGFEQTVEVDFTAGFGYGTAAPYCPSYIQESIIRLTVYLYENPNASENQITREDPLGAVSMLRSGKGWNF